MIYMGSKRRIAKYILPIILKDRKQGQYYYEPFVGGANMIESVTAPAVGLDCNKYVIEALKAIRDNKELPKNITEEQYKHIKNNKYMYQDYIVGFVGIVCAFGSVFLGSYARNSRNDNYLKAGINNAEKQRPKLQALEFFHSDYRDFEYKPNSIIYCDPPYKDSTGYGEKFDHDSFYQWCIDMHKKGHKVFISEHDMPDEFKCVWEKDLTLNINNRASAKKRIEKLFVVDL